MDLDIGLGGECFVTEPALEVPPPLVYHLHVCLELHPAGQEFATNITGEQLFRNNLALGVNTVLPGPAIRKCEDRTPKKNVFLMVTCVRTETWQWRTWLDSTHS